MWNDRRVDGSWVDSVENKEQSDMALYPPPSWRNRQVGKGLMERSLDTSRIGHRCVWIVWCAEAFLLPGR